MSSKVPSSNKFTITSDTVITREIINDKPDGTTKPAIQRDYVPNITQTKCHGWMPQSHIQNDPAYSSIIESEDSDKFTDFEELGSNNMEEQYN